MKPVAGLSVYTPHATTCSGSPVPPSLAAVTARWEPTAAAVPARDERDTILQCLQALDAQVGARLDHIVVLVNNATDGTAALARSFRPHPATQLHVLERSLAPAQANAGHARRLAMEAAFALAGPQGVLLTTDADAAVDPDWLAANLAALRAGADAVAGWVELDPVGHRAIPARLHADDARECAYDALCDEIHARLDPDPADPMPRHTQHSGASIAVTGAAYRRCGGIPDIAVGEDRAFIAALRRVDAGVRHAPEVHVVVSGRTEGRSPGGMADTIRRRLIRPDPFLDDRLEPATDCVRRARLRAALRRLYDEPMDDPSAIAQQCGLAPEAVAAAVNAPYFGAAWQAVESAAPLLRRQLVAVSDLPVQMEVATAIVATLRGAPGVSGPDDQSGSQFLAAEGLE